MRSIQYKVIEIKSGKLFGFIVGKTSDPNGVHYLVIDRGSRNHLLKITPRTEKLYRVEAADVSA